MTVKSLNRLLTGSLLLALALPAQAQEAAEETAVEATVLPEIIVTAQKRKESQLDVPISVSAIGADTLKERGIDKIDEVGRMTPNLDVAALPRTSYIRIRGLGSGDNKGFEQSIGLFVDGVYYGRAEYLNDAMLDIGQVEILRGPQGTLFGKNTVAGALNITTANPSDEWEFWGSGAFGELDEQKYQATINAPIIEDVLSLRIAGKIQERDGFVWNRKLNRDEANLDKSYFRAKLAFTGISGIEVILAGDVGDLEARGNGYQLSAISEPATTIYTQFDADLETDLSDFETSLDYPGYTFRDSWGASLTINADVWGDHQLTAIAAMNGYEFEVSDDVDFGPAPLLSFLYDDEYEQQSAEIRIASGEGVLEYVAGAYYFFSDYHSMTDFTVMPEFAPLLIVGEQALPGALSPIFQPILDQGPAFNGDNRHKVFLQETTHMAAYIQANLNLTDRLTLIGGLRYSFEEKDQFQEQTFENGGLPYQLLTGDTAFAATASREETNWSPKLSGKFDILEGVMLYATWARGFKAGGFNEMATSEADMRFDEETADTYEGGVKAKFWGGKATATAGYFHTSFDNLQIAVWDGTGFIVTNAEEATTQGAELELNVLPIERLMLTFGGGWTDATYDKFTNGPCMAGEGKGCDLTGQTLNQAPEWNYAVAAQYDQPVMGNIALFVGADYYWQSKMYLTPDLDEEDAQEAYNVLNGRLGLRDMDGIWSFTVHGRNLTDEVVKQESFDVPLFAGTHFAVVTPPRLFSMEFRVNF